MSPEEQDRMQDTLEGLVKEQIVNLAADRPQIYQPAQKWFLQQGEKIVPLLVQGLEDESLGSVCHWRILVLLQYFAQEETIPAILQALRTALERRNHIVIPGAMEALAVFSAPETIRMLIELTQESDPDIVKHAAALLGKTGDAAAAEPLLRLLGSDNPSIRYSAVRGLIQLEDPSVRTALKRHLEIETDVEVRELIESTGIGAPNKSG
jgi:HEAT repeat protein